MIMSLVKWYVMRNLHAFLYTLSHEEGSMMVGYIDLKYGVAARDAYYAGEEMARNEV